MRFSVNLRKLKYACFQRFRNCGHLFCHKCCHEFVHLPHIQLPGPTRICRKCSAELNEANHISNMQTPSGAELQLLQSAISEDLTAQNWRSSWRHHFIVFECVFTVHVHFSFVAYHFRVSYGVVAAVFRSHPKFVAFAFLLRLFVAAPVSTFDRIFRSDANFIFLA